MSPVRRMGEPEKGADVVTLAFMAGCQRGGDWIVGAVWDPEQWASEYIAAALPTDGQQVRDADGWRPHAAKVLEGFDTGVFVRDNSGDVDPAWAIKLLPYLNALAKLQEAIAPPDPPTSVSTSDTRTP